MRKGERCLSEVKLLVDFGMMRKEADHQPCSLLKFNQESAAAPSGPPELISSDTSHAARYHYCGSNVRSLTIACPRSFAGPLQPASEMPVATSGPL